MSQVFYVAICFSVPSPFSFLYYISDFQPQYYYLVFHMLRDDFDGRQWGTDHWFWLKQTVARERFPYHRCSPF